MNDWPFEQPENEAVLTTRHVVEEGAPILRVSRDEDDGAWQFHTDRGAPNPDDARVLALREIVDLDPSLHELADLEPGWVAMREAQGRLWRRHRESDVEGETGR